MSRLYQKGIVGAGPGESLDETITPTNEDHPQVSRRAGMRWISPETILVGMGGILVGRLLERIIR